MSNPEGAFIPRPRKSESYIPIDEVSNEDIDRSGGFDWAFGRSPEEEIFDTQDEWKDWFTEEVAVGPDEDLPYDLYTRNEEDRDAQWWERVNRIGEELDGLGSDPDDFGGFAERHGLPDDITRKDVERLVSRQRKRETARVSDPANRGFVMRPTHGYRGKEMRDKHERGEQPAVRFDWKASLPDDFRERLEQDVSMNGGELEQNRQTFEAEMDLIADYAHLENLKFGDSRALISWGQKRNHIDDFEADRLRSVFG